MHVCVNNNKIVWGVWGITFFDESQGCLNFRKTNEKNVQRRRSSIKMVKDFLLLGTFKVVFFKLNNSKPAVFAIMVKNRTNMLSKQTQLPILLFPFAFFNFIDISLTVFILILPKFWKQIDFHLFIYIG